jgi:hypothetical protein
LLRLFDQDQLVLENGLVHRPLLIVIPLSDTSLLRPRAATAAGWGYRSS